jgi:hypothetical protein
VTRYRGSFDVSVKAAFDASLAAFGAQSPQLAQRYRDGDVAS